MNTSRYILRDKKRELPVAFEPGNYDVICGRGGRSPNHIGNKRFRSLVHVHLKAYAVLATKEAKSKIISKIIDIVQSQSQNGGFVNFDKLTRSWHEVGDHLAKEKVGQTIRNALHLKYQSSNKAKRRRRIAEQATAAKNVKEITEKKSNFKLSSMIKNLHSPKGVSSMKDDEFVKFYTNANLGILNEFNKILAAAGDS